MTSAIQKIIKELEKIKGEKENVAKFLLAVLEVDDTYNLNTEQKIWTKINENYGINWNGTNLESSDFKLEQSIKAWLDKTLIEDGILNLDNKEGERIDENTLNNLTSIISACLDGGLSKDSCKAMIVKVDDMKPLQLAEQSINIKNTVLLLKKMGFKIYERDALAVAGTDKLPQFESVDEWKERNTDLNLTNETFLNVLKIYVTTANAYADHWNENKIIKVVYSKEKEEEKPKKINLVPMVVGVRSQLDSLTGFQKYLAGLLPIKARNLGLLSQSGGAGLINYDSETKDGLYLSYVDEEVDTNKYFFTAKVLGEMIGNMKKELEGKNIKIKEMDQIEENLKKLYRDEIKLANLTSVIEKYFALKKYFGVQKEPKDIRETLQLLETHRNKLEKVDKRRNGIGNVLYIFARYLN